MSGYRLYVFDGKHRGYHRAARTVPLFAASEEQALRHAEEHRQGQYAELWRHEHLVKVFEAD